MVLAAIVPISVWIYHGTAFDSIVGADRPGAGGFRGALVVSTSRSTTAYELDRLSDNILFGLAGLAVSSWSIGGFLTVRRGRSCKLRCSS